MSLALYLASASMLLAAAFVVFRVLVRRDYRRFGRLPRLTGFLELALWMLVVFFPCQYNPPDWMLVWFGDPPISLPLRIIGGTATAAGILVTLAAVSGLGVGRTMGQGSKTLRTTGLYLFSRNPQIVGCALMLAGCALLWPSWYGLGWVILCAAVGHMMVLTEEEHLRNIYGEEYTVYCKRTPRYVGIPRPIS
jgi:protein-S-isoprenylcysteine O-methyltransferase Ste14